MSGIGRLRVTQYTQINADGPDEAVTAFKSAESKLDHVCAGSAPSAAPADAVQLAAEFLGEKLGPLSPKAAIVLGSGLGGWPMPSRTGFVFLIQRFQGFRHPPSSGTAGS